jgi:hypothetical protein
MATQPKEGESGAVSASVERVQPAAEQGATKWSGAAKPPTERKSIKDDPEGKSNAGKGK